MIIAVLLLAAALAVCAVLLTVRTQNIKALTHALKNHSAARLAAPDRRSEALAGEIDRLQEQQRAADILHRRREDQLRQDIASISHDLRTPLTSIRGYLQLLEDRTLPDVQRREYLEIIGRRTDALQQLVNGFYDLSRLEAGGYPIQLQPIRLEILLANLIADSYDELTRRGIEPEISLPENLPPVLADAASAERVFQNLFQNALRYGSRLAITAELSGKVVFTRFENDAPDLTQADIPRLFDRFYTADRSRSQGTGLGLAIVKSLCGAMDAEAEARLSQGRLTIEIRWRTS